MDATEPAIAEAASVTRRQLALVASLALVTTVFGCRRPAISPGAARREKGILPGYPANARLLIINADDIAISPSVNAAVVAAFDRKLIDSGTVMVPCPSFPEFAKWARAHPEADIGIHLTFTSLATERWRPILPTARVRSLVDADGYFPVSWPVGRVVVADEVHAEILAQIAHARELGIEPSHLDSHQHVLQLRGSDVYGALVRAARETRLPFRVARSWDQRAPYLVTGHDATVPLARLIAISADSQPSPEEWSGWYAAQVRALPPGLSEMFLHPGFADTSLNALLPGARPAASKGRQRDFDALGSDVLRVALNEPGVTRVNWRQVRRAIANR